MMWFVLGVGWCNSCSGFLPLLSGLGEDLLLGWLEGVSLKYAGMIGVLGPSG